MRFLLELVRRAKAVLGDELVLGVRGSADEHVPGGTTYADMQAVVQRLEREGVDYFHLGDGCFESLKYTIPDEAGTMLEEAAGFKKLVRLPIITPSVHDPEAAEHAVREGKTDMISLGRQLIVDPDWANKAKSGRVGEIRKCDRCNRGCFARIFQGLRVKCVLNPESGLEKYNPRYTRWAVRQRGIEQRRRGKVAPVHHPH
jgi:2,4-dienoyl-CoA reductase-like NADH-dependent reductase (Old Yellow Enzyme family)